jgi:diguanylate cyclase (GGDEF)-like protein
LCKQGGLNEGAKEAHDGIQSVLAGKSAYFSMEYPCDLQEKKQWFMMSVTPQQTPQSGVIVSHINITDRRRMEEDQHELINNIQLLAMTDSLTGLENRRSIEDRLRAELNRSMRANHPCTIMIADIDDLKQINDSHGHRFGDLVLKEAAKSMKECKRDYDWIGRYGGDEFPLIYPDTLSGDALNIAERLRKSVNEIQISLDGRQFQKLSVSVGFFEVQPDEMKELSIEKIVDYADKALYHAKRMGRNRVVDYRKINP